VNVNENMTECYEYVTRALKSFLFSHIIIDCMKICLS